MPELKMFFATFQVTEELYDNVQIIEANLFYNRDPSVALTRRVPVSIAYGRIYSDLLDNDHATALDTSKNIIKKEQLTLPLEECLKKISWRGETKQWSERKNQLHNL